MQTSRILDIVLWHFTVTEILEDKHTDANPEVMIFVDAENVFNRLNRQVALCTTQATQTLSLIHI